MSKALSITRLIVILLSTIVAGCSIYLLVRLGVHSETWTIWTPLIVSVLSYILFACSLNPKIRVSAARNVFAFIIAVGWFISPCYHINRIVRFAYYSTSNSASFFSIWNCGTIICSVWMTMDICGLLAGVLSLLEIGLAILASRRLITPDSNKTSVLVAPGGQQQYTPLQQPPQQPPQQQFAQQQFAQQPYYQPASNQAYYAQGQPPTATTSYPQTY